MHRLPPRAQRPIAARPLAILSTCLPPEIYPASTTRSRVSHKYLMPRHFLRTGYRWVGPRPSPRIPLAACRSAPACPSARTSRVASISSAPSLSRPFAITNATKQSGGARPTEPSASFYAVDRDCRPNVYAGACRARLPVGGRGRGAPNHSGCSPGRQGIWTAMISSSTSGVGVGAGPRRPPRFPETRVSWWTRTWTVPQMSSGRVVQN